MKKIAIIRCLRTSNTCSGSGCMKAFNNRDKMFSQYGEEPIELTAFLNCSGCGAEEMPNSEASFKKKLDRLVDLGIDVVHMSGCTNKKDAQGEKRECPIITKAAEYLQEHGITIVRGTHH